MSAATTPGSPDQEPEENLADRVTETVGEALASALAEHSSETLLAALEALTETLTALVARNMEAHPPPSPIHCHAGCSACCYTPRIGVTEPEVLRVAHYLNETFSESARARILDHARRAAENPGPEPCPLLSEDGLCSVHPARPFVCRAVLSMDVAACERAKGLHDHPPIPVYHPSDVIFKAAQAGLMLGCKRAGLAPTPLELRRAVALVLEDAETGQRWLAGEDAFAAARLPEKPGATPEGRP